MIVNLFFLVAEAFDKDIVWLERPPWDGWLLVELVGPWLKRNLPKGSKRGFDFHFRHRSDVLLQKAMEFAGTGRHWYVGQLPRKDQSANLSSWKSTSNCFRLIHISWFMCLWESEAPPWKNEWKSFSKLCLSWEEIEGLGRVGAAIRVHVSDSGCIETWVYMSNLS